MKIKNALLSTLIVSTAAVVLSSCCACRKGSPKVGTLEQDSWKLVELAGKALPNSGIVLTFNGTEKMIYGTAPCNNFFASYSLFKEQNNIEIGAVGATRMACPDMDLELQFTADLNRVVRLKMEGSKLLMIDAQGELIALLESTPPAVQE